MSNKVKFLPVVRVPDEVDTEIERTAAELRLKKNEAVRFLVLEGLARRRQLTNGQAQTA